MIAVLSVDLNNLKRINDSEGHAASLAELKRMIEKISDEMKQTPYRCAIGLAEYRQGESFDNLCARADADMYQMKTELKKQTE